MAMSKTNVERTLDTLVEFADLQNRSIRELRETIAESNQQLSDRIDQMNASLVNRIDDLAVQIGSQAQSISRLEQAINALAEDSKTQNATAQLQAQNVAELIRTVRELAIARG
jgi:hypothetical protein